MWKDQWQRNVSLPKLLQMQDRISSGNIHGPKNLLQQVSEHSESQFFSHKIRSGDHWQIRGLNRVLNCKGQMIVILIGLERLQILIGWGFRPVAHPYPIFFGNTPRGAVTVPATSIVLKRSSNIVDPQLKKLKHWLYHWWQKNKKKLK